MKEFTYTIQEAVGIHARPAGLLVKEVKKYESTVTITKGDKSVNALKLMASWAWASSAAIPSPSPWKVPTKRLPLPLWKLSSRPICNFLPDSVAASRLAGRFFVLLCY
mgnify:CR=1 FL=1